MVDLGLPIEEFLTSGRLHIGDILLFYRRRSGFGQTLQTLVGATEGAPFAHSAMVFATPQSDPGFRKVHVLECNFSGALITPLEDYVRKRSSSVICVKRLERDWMNDRLRKCVRGFALTRIAADASLDTLTDRFLRAEAHVLFPKRQPPSKRARFLRQALRHGHKLPRAFICAGFIQYAYFEAVRREFQRIGPDDGGPILSDCYFAQERRTDSLEADLLSVTAQDLADTPKLNWKLLVHRAQVIEVATEDDVTEIMGANDPVRARTPAPKPSLVSGNSSNAINRPAKSGPERSRWTKESSHV